MQQAFHIRDEELLRRADGELAWWRRFQVNAHLQSCEQCRERWAALQTASANFVQMHQDRFASRITSSGGPEALLRAKLPPAASSGQVSGLLQTAAALLLLLGAGLFFVSRHKISSEASPVPRMDLTPGAASTISVSEACRMENFRSNRSVPAALQEAVFREYGIRNPRSRSYEVDYLITPELGGTADIRNLWPEPYYTPVWNAHVKDALEDRLHALVCSGQVDLATAQRDLSTDWIAAYQKYFHTDRPEPSR